MLAVAEPIDSNVTQTLRPEHIRAIALRVQGRTWSEIAAELGVTPWTTWKWRQDYPEIEEEIARQSSDLLSSSAHGLAALLPLSVDALREVIQTGENRDRVAASKVVIDALRRGTGDRLPDAVDAEVRKARELTAGEVQGELERRAADPDSDPDGPSMG